MSRRVLALSWTALFVLGACNSAAKKELARPLDELSGLAHVTILARGME